jgi:HK97 family phage prohead protease
MGHKMLSTLVYNEKSKTEPRVVIGVAAVFGNVDAGGDMVAPGAFTKEVANFKAGRSRARFLWNHDKQQPPIAEILEIKQVGRDALPPAVLAKAPAAQGGLVVKRRYFKDQFSERVYQGVVTGAVSEMSFAYDVVEDEVVNLNGQSVRLLKQLALYDLSDVLWGMNAATVAAGAKKRSTVTQNSAKLRVQKAQIQKLGTFLKTNCSPISQDQQHQIASLRLHVLKERSKNSGLLSAARAESILLRGFAATLR